MSNNSYNFYPRLDGLQLIEADSITTSDLTTNTLTANSFKTNLVHSIPFEQPEPVRRVGLAWRRGFMRPEVIDALVHAVQSIDNPCYKPVA